MRYAALVVSMASIALAQSTTLTVNANQGPWEQSANPNFTYGYGDNAAPATGTVIIPIRIPTINPQPR